MYRMIQMSFSYVLVMELYSDSTLQIGKLGTITLSRGTYAYIGSAHSEKRLERHLRSQKKIHWHIDYFLQKAKITAIYISKKPECELAQKIALPYIPGFGCSDCRCPSHLFYGHVPFLQKLIQYYP